MSWFARNPKKTLACLALAGVLGVDFLMALAVPRPGVRYRVPHPVYHHDLLPDVEDVDIWGPITNPLFTNSLGFKDAARRQVDPAGGGYRVLFLGDSFTEGGGVPWEESFVGRISDVLDGEVEVLNAAVSSYSPKLYYLKARYLLDEVGLRVDEIVVFIDISDPQDEFEGRRYKPRFRAHVR